MKPVLTVWDPRYCCEAAPLTSTTKQQRVVTRALELKLLEVQRPPCWLDESWADAASWEAIARIHAPAYVQAVRTGNPLDLAQSQGFTWSPAFADSVRRIWHGHELAVRYAQSHAPYPVLHPVSGAHHAHKDRGSAFCTFNYLVGAVETVETIERCLIVDLDAHYGDGTDALTETDSRFLHFDIAGSLRGSSSFDETSRGEWHTVADVYSYFRALDRLQKLLDDERLDLVQIQAGADPYLLDDVGGITGMTVAKLKLRDRKVLQWCYERNLPTVVTFAGGYSTAAGEIHLNTIREMSEL